MMNGEGVMTYWGEGRHRTVKEFVTPAGGAGDLVVCKIIRCARIKE
jgi:hypothetical protein